MCVARNSLGATESFSCEDISSHIQEKNRSRVPIVIIERILSRTWICISKENIGICLFQHIHRDFNFFLRLCDIYPFFRGYMLVAQLLTLTIRKTSLTGVICCRWHHLPSLASTAWLRVMCATSNSTATIHRGAKNTNDICSRTRAVNLSNVLCVITRAPEKTVSKDMLSFVTLNSFRIMAGLTICRKT